MFQDLISSIQKQLMRRKEFGLIKIFSNCKNWTFYRHSPKKNQVEVAICQRFVSPNWIFINWIYFCMFQSLMSSIQKELKRSNEFEFVHVLVQQSQQWNLGDTFSNVAKKTEGGGRMQVKLRNLRTDSAQTLLYILLIEQFSKPHIRWYVQGLISCF